MIELNSQNYLIQYHDRKHEDMVNGMADGKKLVLDGIEVRFPIGIHEVWVYLLILYVKDDLLELYHRATQQLCSVIQPCCSKPESRHEWLEDDPNPRVMRYWENGSNNEGEERKGVTHLVQGWIQQAQKEKVCVKLHNLEG